jgi:hypothetical protein
VEKSQYKLCVEVLRRFDKAGILRHVVLVGSWCSLFYKEYFVPVRYTPVLKTRDIDFLIPRPWTIKVKVDAAQLLEELGFVVGFTGSQGYSRLEHPQLIVEFLVPERGKASDKPYPLPQLGLNAQALRFMDFLCKNTITTTVEGMAVTVPHPANFALQKLLILNRRNLPEKTLKDKEAAIQILKALTDKQELSYVKTVFNSMPTRWKTKVKKILTEIEQVEILDILQ